MTCALPRHTSAAGLLVAVLVLVGPAPASVEYWGPAKLAEHARQIIIGDVTAIDYYWEDEGRGLIRTSVTVTVAQYLFGTGSGLEVARIPGGTMGALTQVVSIYPVFETGDHVLLFLDDSDARLVGAFQGAYLTDGREVARLGPACAGVIESSFQALDQFLEELAGGLPDGTALPPIWPSPGERTLPRGDRYEFCGPSWRYQDNPMGELYHINPNCTDLPAGSTASQIQQIQNGASAWNNAGAEFAFAYGGTSSLASEALDDVNLVFFSPNLGDPTVIAETSIWSTDGDIVECDMALNDQFFAWWDGSGQCNNWMDIWNITAHEFGHFLCLDDLYGAAYADATMYGFSATCDIHLRDLAPDDVAGIRALYGWGGGVWVHFAFTGSESGTYFHPYNTLAEGVNAVTIGYPINIKAGVSAECPTINKACTLTAFGGTVVIGQ